jgi:hypothetical protein
MLKRRTKWILAAIGIIAVIAAVWSVKEAHRPSAAERYIADAHVQGFRMTMREIPSDITAVSYWVGPALPNPLDLVRAPRVKWSVTPYPDGYISSNYSGNGSGFDGIGYANVQQHKPRCSAFVDRLSRSFWTSNGRQLPFSAWRLTRNEADGIREGRLVLLAVGVTCWEDERHIE